MNKKKNRLVQRSIIGIFVLLYAFVSLISTIHVIDFFEMTNPRWLAIALAVAFEFGAAASLAAIVVGEKTNKTIVWGLFFILTAFQMQGNMWYAYVNAVDYMAWVEMFMLNDMDVIAQKRILAAVSGAVLPLVALGFIKSLVDYIKPDELVNDAKIIIEAFENPPEPNDKLKAAAEAYKASKPEENPPVKQRATPSSLIQNKGELKDKYTEEKSKRKVKDPEVSADIETFGENLNIEVKDDVKTFGENLRKPETPSMDKGLQQKNKPTAT